MRYIEVTYQHTTDLLHVSTDANWASLIEPRYEDDSNSYRSMPSLASYGSDTESDDESDLKSVIDVTRLYRRGELEDEWSETMEEETMEELDINEILANYMESNLSLVNPQKAFWEHGIIKFT